MDRSVDNTKSLLHAVITPMTRPPKDPLPFPFPSCRAYFFKVESTVPPASYPHPRLLPDSQHPSSPRYTPHLQEALCADARLAARARVEQRVVAHADRTLLETLGGGVGLPEVEEHLSHDGDHQNLGWQGKKKAEVWIGFGKGGPGAPHFVHTLCSSVSSLESHPGKHGARRPSCMV